MHAITKVPLQKKLSFINNFQRKLVETMKTPPIGFQRTDLWNLKRHIKTSCHEISLKKRFFFIKNFMNFVFINDQIHPPILNFFH